MLQSRVITIITKIDVKVLVMCYLSNCLFSTRRAQQLSPYVLSDTLFSTLLSALGHFQTKLFYPTHMDPGFSIRASNGSW